MPRSINPRGIRKNNTIISEEGGIVSCQLYATVIATWNKAAGSVLLNTGGFNTPTTIRRMNECLHHWGFSAQVSQADLACGSALICGSRHS